MQSPICIHSEVGKLKKVLVHRPGMELENLIPEYLSHLLFDDIPYLNVAREEHDFFTQTLRECGAEVIYLKDLLTEAVEAAGAKEQLVEDYIREAHVYGLNARQALRESRTAAEANLAAYVTEASEEAEAALKKAAEEAAKAAAAKAAQTTNTSTNDSTELPSNGGKLSSGGRALAATKTGGNFKASVYTGNTGASNLSYYQSLNSDVKAWLKIPGTNINYPVLQNASEDHYYLHRGLDRGQSYYGVLWTQTATRFGSGDSLSSNNVIYGHNWKNCRWNAAPSTYYAGQQMFESLLSYHYTSWAEQYPYIYYSTPSEEMAFVIFACFYTEGSDWYINAEGNIDGVISGAQSRSRHNFGVDVNSSDKLLTLSTCTRYYGNTDNQRFVVMARLLRPGEEMGPVSVTYNPNHQQPNVWG